MAYLTRAAWGVFKLSFGLFSLFMCWLSVAIKNGELGARDTDEEKKELEAGAHSVTQLMSCDR